MSDDFKKMLHAHIAKVEGRDPDDTPAASPPEKPAEQAQPVAEAKPDQPAKPAVAPAGEAKEAAAPEASADDGKPAPAKAADAEPQQPVQPDISKLPPEFQDWYRGEQEKRQKEAENLKRLSNKVKHLGQTLSRREHEIADLRASVVGSGSRAAPAQSSPTAASSPNGTPPSQATVSPGVATEVFASPEWQTLKKDYPEMAVLERAFGSIAEQVASQKAAATTTGADPALIERLARLEERIELERFKDVETRHKIADHVGVTLDKSGNVIGVEPRSREFAWFWYGLPTDMRGTVNWNDPADIDALFSEMQTELGKLAPASAAPAPAPAAPAAPQPNDTLTRAAAPSMKPATIVRSSTANAATLPFADAMREHLRQRGYTPNL